MTIVGLILSLPPDLWAASAAWARHALVRCKARLGVKAGPAASDEQRDARVVREALWHEEFRPFDREDEAA